MGKLVILTEVGRLFHALMNHATLSQVLIIQYFFSLISSYKIIIVNSNIIQQWIFAVNENFYNVYKH